MKKNIFFSALILLLLTAFLELGTGLLLRRIAQFRPYPFFYAGDTQANPGAGIMALGVLDPLLGWTQSPDFHQYESKGAAGAKKTTIVALGGSTSDPMFEKQNWAWQLTELCEKAGLACDTWNGAIGGYNSSQELIKLVRDVLPKKPDIVISLNGINDQAVFSFDGHSFEIARQREMTEFLARALRNAGSPLYSPPALPGALPNVRFLLALLRHSLIGGAQPAVPVSYGARDHFSTVERWARNVRMMHAVAAEFGARYFVFLQPSLGLDPEGEAAMRGTPKLETPQESTSIPKFWAAARLECARLPYCHDLSLPVEPWRKHFYDLQHLRREGHKLEGELIFAHLKKKGAFR